LPPTTLVTALQLGQLLKNARKRQKLTQAQLAAQLGLSQNRVSHLELHPDELSFRQLLAWCAVVALELRLGEREPMDPSNKAEW
jgi:HTH-type transcriptional regulator/antitoxin HipB